jgi:hypothetical protein
MRDTRKSPTEESGTLKIFSALGGAAAVCAMGLEPVERRASVPAAVAGGSSRDNVVEVKVAKRSAWISKWLHTAGTMELGEW